MFCCTWCVRYPQWSFVQCLLIKSYYVVCYVFITFYMYQLQQELQVIFITTSITLTNTLTGDYLCKRVQLFVCATTEIMIMITSSVSVITIMMLVHKCTGLSLGESVHRAEQGGLCLKPNSSNPHGATHRMQFKCMLAVYYPYSKKWCTTQPKVDRPFEWPHSFVLQNVMCVCVLSERWLRIWPMPGVQAQIYNHRPLYYVRLLNYSITQISNQPITCNAFRHVNNAFRQDCSRQSAEVQTEHQNGEERWFKSRGMVVGVRKNISETADLLGFSHNHLKGLPRMVQKREREWQFCGQKCFVDARG